MSVCTVLLPCTLALHHHRKVSPREGTESSERSGSFTSSRFLTDELGVLASSAELFYGQCLLTSTFVSQNIFFQRWVRKPYAHLELAMSQSHKLVPCPSHHHGLPKYPHSLLLASLPNSALAPSQICSLLSTNGALFSARYPLLLLASLHSE